MGSSGRSRPPRSPKRARPHLARERALQVLLDFEAQPFPLQGRLERDQSQLSDPDERHFFRRLVPQVLRHRTRLDAWIQPVLSRGDISALPAPIRGILRLGAAQIALFDRVPEHAIVDTSVEMAKHRGHRGTAGLVNAVLRRLLRSRGEWEALDRHQGKTAGLARAYSHPEWLVQAWNDAWGAPATLDILEWNQREPVLWIRCAPQTLAPEGTTAGWVPGTARFGQAAQTTLWDDLKRGHLTIQDPSAVLVGLLAPEVAGTIVDICAAPGTKTGHLRERARAESGEGVDNRPADSIATHIIAADRSRGRLLRLRRGLAERDDTAKGSIAIDALAMDALSPALPPESCQGVLVDAPCSNLGVLRRRPDVRWRVTLEEIERLAGEQRRILDSAARILAPGGWLVYSVCTIDPAETTAQRQGFMERHPGFEPIETPDFVPSEARRDVGETLLLPGQLETDGGYAFVARKIRAEA